MCTKIPHCKPYFPIVVYKTGRSKECLCSTSNNTKEHFPKKIFLVLFFIRKLNIVGKEIIYNMVFKAAMKLTYNDSLKSEQFFFLTGKRKCSKKNPFYCNPFFNVIFPRSFTLLPLDASQRNIAVKK